MSAPAPPYAEHAEDVLAFAATRAAAGQPVALAMVTGTLGGAVRAPGALMAVTEDGTRCGYLSGGCIDADLALRAEAALATGQAQTLRYGVGSAFGDITLPCGGAIDVAIDPAPARSGIDRALKALRARQPVGVWLTAGRLRFGSPAGAAPPLATYRPKLALRIAGRGADPIALASLAHAAGYRVTLWTPDEACTEAARAAGLPDCQPLTSHHALPTHQDDRWTAFMLMFHDPHWEDVLLTQALAGDAFHVGAVGSPRTHAMRCDRLRAGGIAPADIARIKGPVGLVPSMRNATSLAISALAEIVGAYETLPGPAAEPPRETTSPAQTGAAAKRVPA
ncbi:MAG: XdhC family protein [Pseudomonadota bacterium]